MLSLKQHKNPVQYLPTDKGVRRSPKNHQQHNPLWSHIATNTNVQTKLTVGANNDEYEQEADAVADQVMRMPGNSGDLDEKFSESSPPLQSKPISTSNIQQMCTECEDELAGGKSSTVQTKSNSATPHTSVLQSVSKTIHSPYSGTPLNNSIRLRVEPVLGADLSSVRVHSDASAHDASQRLNAKAFTHKNNIFLGKGQSSSDIQLMAHEATHVIQQGTKSSRIQRKIIIGGTQYTPNSGYYAYLDANFGSHMKEFIKNMHNNGNPPDFNFTSKEQMGYEVRVRHQAIEGIKTVHDGCCNYPDSGHPQHLDPTYWDRVGWMHFKPKSPLPAGKEASDAIEAIFAPGAGTRLECMSTTVAVEYYSLLKGLGKSKFNVQFAGGVGLEISTRLSGSAHPTFYGASRLYKNLTLANKSEILPGDWVYFKNFADYLAKHPGGSWQGENAIYLGNGKYRGFGVAAMSEDDMNKELVDVYNTGLPVADQKTVADLVAAGRGLRLAPVFRPDIAKLVP